MDGRGGGPAPQQPQPAPLPVGQPARPRRGGLIVGIVVVGALLVLCSCCGLPMVLGPLAERYVGPALQKRVDSAEVRRSVVPLRAYWALRGAYAVIQSTDDRGLARVIVWERATGRIREIDGYRFIAAEEATAVAWLARDSLEATPDPLLLQGPDGVWDAAGGRVARLRLDGEEPLVEVTSAAWSPWPSGKGVTAYCAVEASSSPFPRRISFRRAAREIGAIPLNYRNISLRPLGWSPSGRYFAAVGLPDMNDEQPGAEFNVVFFDTTTGSSRTWDLQPARDHTGFRFVWDASKDELWYVAGLPEDPPGLPTFTVITPAGDDEDRPVEYSVDDTVPMGVGEFAGSSRRGPVFFADGKLMVREGSAVRTLGRLDVALPGFGRMTVPASYADYDEHAGVVWTAFSPTTAGEFEKTVYVSRSDGTHRRPIWHETMPNPAAKLLGLDRLGGR